MVQSPFEHVRAVLSVDEFDGLMACLGFYPAAPGALVLDQNSAGKAQPLLAIAVNTLRA